jgi:putative drug exporter of the RND superfamily
MPDEDASADPVRSGRPSRAFAAVVVLLRLPIIAGLVAAAVCSARYLPGISSLPSSGVRALLPANTGAERAEAESDRLFGSSLLPRTAVVQRAPGGLSPRAQRRIVRTAVLMDEGRLAGFPQGSRAAPYLDTRAALPGSRESSTTAITFLGFPRNTTPAAQARLAQRYASAVSQPTAAARPTGFVPGSVAQSNLISRDLFRVEIASVLTMVAILAVYLRSLLVPLVTLVAAGITYLISIGVVAYLARFEGQRLDSEVKPIVVVLLLGVVTDYSVFFMSDMRARLIGGEARRDAAVQSTAQVVPIVFTAALLVAAGLATLRLASIGFVQALGPAMAIVVLVGLCVSTTLVPAVMGVLGRALFWPGLRDGSRAEPWRARAGATVRRGVAWAGSRRLLAPPIVALVLAALVWAAWHSGAMRLALTPIRGLPTGAAPARAARDAGRGFTPGILAPTEIVVRGPGVGARQRRVVRLQRELAAQPEVGAVLGAGTAQLPRRYEATLRTPSGNAVRYFVAFRDHPYSSAGVSDLDRLKRSMPALMAGAGLRGAGVLYAGDTALAQEAIASVRGDMLRVGIAAALVNLLVLALFLRSIVAPVVLVASSAVAIAATFGVTTLLFRALWSTTDVTYYVPLAVGVLLLSFGTDYNLFVVGRIWQESDRTGIAAAVRTAVPRAGRAISIAGIALAASFAMLALVPIRPFRELAVAIALGVVIDTFVVRTLLIPSVFTTLGAWSWWPAAAARHPDGIPEEDEPGRSRRLTDPAG